ncbi:UNVERIFIED_CONTAM: hypothetical protein K2H54_056391 [Gekko kuhli]
MVTNMGSSGRVLCFVQPTAAEACPSVSSVLPHSSNSSPGLRWITLFPSPLFRLEYQTGTTGKRENTFFSKLVDNLWWLLSVFGVLPLFSKDNFARTTLKNS